MAVSRLCHDMISREGCEASNADWGRSELKRGLAQKDGLGFVGGDRDGRDEGNGRGEEDDEGV